MQDIHISIGMDDYIQGASLDICTEYVQDTRSLIQSLRFTFFDKLSPIPSQTSQHLGFVLDCCDGAFGRNEKKKKKKTW